MKKEIAKKWVKALRSGKYKQGKRALKVETKKGVQQHCCLGVLCELYQQDRGKKQALPLTTRVTSWEKSTCSARSLMSAKIFAFGRDEYTTVVPPSVQRWAGLADPAGEFREGAVSAVSLNAAARGKDCSSLAELNDAGASFKRIASIIENSAEQL